MSTRVDDEGQVMIAREIRDALGIVPGSLVLQRRVGDTVELRFLPPEHSRSLHGILAQYVTTTLSETDERVAEETAWAADAVRRDEEAMQGRE